MSLTQQTFMKPVTQQYLISTYYAPGTVLAFGSMGVKETKSLASVSSHLLKKDGQQTSKQIGKPHKCRGEIKELNVTHVS